MKNKHIPNYTALDFITHKTSLEGISNMMDIYSKKVKNDVRKEEFKNLHEASKLIHQFMQDLWYQNVQLSHQNANLIIKFHQVNKQ